MTDMKHDTGKPRFDLMPWCAVALVIDVLTLGTAKYSPRGWMTAPNAYRLYYAAALRHLWARAKGEKLDAESGLPHLAHAACNLLILCELELDGKDTDL